MVPVLHSAPHLAGEPARARLHSGRETFSAMSLDLRPTEVWNIKTRDGRHVRAMLFPRGLEVTLVWFVNDRPEGTEDFIEEGEAMQRADELRVAFES